MEMGRGERVDYAPQTRALPPGWPTSRVERGKRNMGWWVGGLGGSVEGLRRGAGREEVKRRRKQS